MNQIGNKYICEIIQKYKTSEYHCYQKSKYGLLQRYCCPLSGFLLLCLIILNLFGSSINDKQVFDLVSFKTEYLSLI